MGMFEKSRQVFRNWDVEAFRDLHHEDFFFIRETELLTLDEHVENIARLVETTNILERVLQQTLIHENEHITEIRWQEGNEVVTNVMLKREDDKIWRSIVIRNPLKNRSKYPIRKLISQRKVSTHQTRQRQILRHQNTIGLRRPCGIVNSRRRASDHHT